VHGTDRQQLAELSKGQLRKKLLELEAALQGRFTRHHALIVGEILTKLDYLDGLIERLSVEVGQAIAPFAQQVQLLDTIPGVDRPDRGPRAARIFTPDPAEVFGLTARWPRRAASTAAPRRAPG
jgi:hypothetical protein